MKIWIIQRHETDGESIVLGTAYTDHAVAIHVLQLLRDTGGVFSLQELNTLSPSATDKRISNLDDLDLTVRSLHVLKAAGIFDVQGVIQAGENKLRTLPNLGPATLNEIKRALSKLGITLGR